MAAFYPVTGAPHSACCAGVAAASLTARPTDVGIAARTGGAGRVRVQDSALREKLRKIEALFAGAATPGERDAAEAAMLRVKARLAEFGRQEPPAEMQYSIQDPWAQRLFIALCRRYGLRPYRYPRQKRGTIMVRLPRAFSAQILWPEFVQLNEVLHAHLSEVTLKLIREHVHADTADAEEVAGKAIGS